MTNIENLVYDKKIYYKRQNNIVKYAKFCKEVNCEKCAYYNYPDEKKKLYCREHKKDDMVNKITKIIRNDNKCKYLDCKKYTKKDFCNMHRYKCLSCDTRIKTNKLCKDHINPKCKHEKCDRDANYRKLKVGNCILKNTNFEYCSYHRPKNSINIKFPYKSIFDKKEIPLEYFNITNIDIFNEYKNHIYKLLKNNKLKFPIKITLYTEFLVYDTEYTVIHLDQQHTIDITHITNYDKYFKNSEVLYQDILNVIKEFKDYYNTQKIEILKLHLNKSLKVNRQENENEYNELLNKFDELDFKTKNSLNKKIYFNEKYDKGIFIELCDLLGYQLEKVTKTSEILSENDINTVLDEIQNNIENNHEKISTDSKKKFLTYRIMDVNIFKYETLKKHVGTYVELPEKLQKRSLINIKNKDEYCFIWSYIRHINPQE